MIWESIISAEHKASLSHMISINLVLEIAEAEIHLFHFKYVLTEARVHETQENERNPNLTTTQN